jgi:hypothetical protein
MATPLLRTLLTSCEIGNRKSVLDVVFRDDLVPAADRPTCHHPPRRPHFINVIPDKAQSQSPQKEAGVRRVFV